MKHNPFFLLIPAAMVFVLLFSSAPTAWSISDIPIIDAHSPVDTDTDIEKVVPLIYRSGIAVTILSTRFERSSQDVVDYAKKHPERIIPAFKTKTRAFMKTESGDKKIVQQEDDNFKFNTMAEVILCHAQKGNKAGQA